MNRSGARSVGDANETKENGGGGRGGVWDSDRDVAGTVGRRRCSSGSEERALQCSIAGAERKKERSKSEARAGRRRARKARKYGCIE